ncbi:MAG: Rieske [2Fe-2S] family domain / Carboxynorspermidine decarboxylase (EC [uncultured Paraburkholderia sp.]|uniref:Rieske 2Fe-2S domain-containing protein n=1 Tax=uncultured Paraburkholderia sp. TaxID=1822466 RepID=UPI0025993B97|nr:Rieske 2Fe-2S domain-containing protein [uncultured Paraburkholderia sp.]CAH2903658.1 MAG: Rieske [2Fe-2S] family domain / Carboxynorspermidine decarboxylase (EC [uncultured Paraburkholderia sp.]CAH2942425.1 MAG: Rieske [2Fe-2S] family domain / Carboxynorspermidine decarboxylase (EC [uncultured Paraburkholderia sp.]
MDHSKADLEYERQLIACGREQYEWVVCARQAAASSLSAWDAQVEALLDGADKTFMLFDRATARYAEQTGVPLSLKHARAFHAATMLRAVEHHADTCDWHLFCRLDEMPNVGDYVTGHAFQESLTAVRSGECEVRVFLNVCPHRQTQIFQATGSFDSRRHIRCPYHGWTFDVDGHCVNAPGARHGGFGADFCQQAYSLSCVPAIVEGRSVLVRKAVSRVSGRIAVLYERVYFAFPDVKRPFVPDRFRVLLRIGFVAAEIRRARDSSILSVLRAELRQHLLTYPDIPAHYASLAKRSGEPTIGIADTNDLGPRLASGPLRETVATWVYGDAELHALERDALILPAWHFVGHMAELDDGERALTLDVSGERAYVYRGRDGAIRAQRLIDVDRRTDDPARLRACGALAPIDVDLWEGLIFVRFASGRGVVADIWEHARMLAPYRIERMAPLVGQGWYDFSVEADAKILWENFLEMYHFPAAHRAMNRLFELSSRSDLLTLREPQSTRLSPVEARYRDALKCGATHGTDEEVRQRAMADSDAVLSRPLQLTVFGSIPETAQTATMLGITVFPDHIQAMSFISVGPRACRVMIRSYGHAVDGALDAARQCNVEQLQIELVEEDIQLNYRSQIAASTRSYYRRGVFNDMEVSVADFQHLLRRTLPVTRYARRPPDGTIAGVNQALGRRERDASRASQSDGAKAGHRASALASAAASSTCAAAAPSVQRRDAETPGTLDALDTPAFVYDERTLRDALSSMRALLGDTGCRLLYPLKPFSQAGALECIAPHVDGFAAASPFEAAFSRALLGRAGSVHFTTPALSERDLGAIVDNCDYVAVNSLSQWSRLHAAFAGRLSCGLRINPQYSVVADSRYDPCRPHSKLGVPLDAMERAVTHDPRTLQGLQGIHFHTNCDSSDFGQLAETIDHIEKRLASTLDGLAWINLGGGYIADNARNVDRFRACATRLRERFGVALFVEPGAAIVRAAGTIVASVVDLFDSGGTSVAVLDTSVNHYPEVFEYQFRPDVAGHHPAHEYAYLLVGASCLAGDVFGTYHFDAPLKVGSRVAFANTGAYTLVKAHRFNGINLPTVYRRDETGELGIVQRFSYDDFLYQNGWFNHACL